MAFWAGRFTDLCLLFAGAGALLRQPALNLFADGDEFSTLLRLLGAILAMGAGIAGLVVRTNRTVDFAFAFLQFLLFSALFGALDPRKVFAGVLLSAMVATWLLESIAISRSRRPTPGDSK